MFFLIFSEFRIYRINDLIRMDISRMDLTMAGESIQFRWIIIFMIYAATVTISLCCSPTDERLFYLTTTTPPNSTVWSEQMVILSFYPSF